MNMVQIHKITRQRIAASQEEAVRALVRTNAMLSDEVDRLQAEVERLQTPLCRVCADEDGGPQATGDDGLCDGCRGVRTLERAKAPNRWMRPARCEPFASLSDGTPLYPAYYPRRPGETYRCAMSSWNGAVGEWVGTTPDARLFRQTQLWGNDSPRPDRWEQFRIT